MQPTSPLSTQLLPILFGLAAILRLMGLGWDDLQGLHPDEGNLVRAAVSLSWPDGLVPSFHAYNGLAVWLPRSLAIPLFGWEASSAEILWTSRLVSALAGTGAVVVGALWARDLAGPGAGVLAAFALGLSAPLIQWAHFGTTESALILIALYLARVATAALDARIAPMRAGLLCGCAIGLGLGLKTTALAFAIIPLSALLMLRLPLALALRATLTGTGLALALWLATTPALVLDRAAWFATMQFERNVVTGAADVFWTWQFADRIPGLFELRQIWGALEGVGLVFAGVGLVVVLSTRSSLRRMAPALLFVSVYAAIVLGWHARFFRYLAPILPFLLILAAIGADAAWRRWTSETARVLLILSAGLFGAMGLDQAAGYLSPDPRISAARDLARRVLPGDIVLREPREVAFGVPHIAQARVMPLDLPLSPADIAAQLAEARFVVIASRRNWSVLPRLGQRAPEACALYGLLATGQLGYRVVSRHVRQTPLGAVSRPGIGMEETRVVFDGPEVLLLERMEERPASELLAALTAATPEEACTPQALQRAWRRPR